MAGSRGPDGTGPLRRLHWRLTSLYVIVGVILLVPLAVLVARADAARRADALDATMRIRAQEAASLAYFEGGRLVLDELRRDPVASGRPEFVVLRGAPPRRPVFASTKPSPNVDVARLVSTAGRASAREELTTGAAEDRRGRAVRLLAAPVYRDNGTAGGAVVVIADPGPADAAHDKLVIALALACGGLLLVASVGGHLLASRTMRPARVALEQQQRFLTRASTSLRDPAADLHDLAESASAGAVHRADLLPRVLSLSARMTGMVDDLILRARLDAGLYRLERRPVRLDELVESAVATATGIVHPAPEISVDTRPCTVMADPHLTRRAIANLVDNALRHGRGARPNAPVEVRVDGEGYVTVADRGPGVGPDVSAALSRGRSSDSLGLGLSIAVAAARLHRGALTVSARQGGGTVVVFRLQPEGAGLEQGWADAGYGTRDASRLGDASGLPPGTPRQ